MKWESVFSLEARRDQSQLYNKLKFYFDIGVLVWGVPLVDEDEFVIDWEYLDIEPGSLWEFDFRDIL